MVDPNNVTRGDEAMILLHFAFRRVIERPDQVLARHGLGRVHHRILFCVGRHPGTRIGQLLKTLDVTKQALNSPLRQLIQRGLIATEADPGNRRAKLLHLTEDGAALEEQLSGEQRERFLRAFRDAGPGAEDAWRRVMRLLAER